MLVTAAALLLAVLSAAATFAVLGAALIGAAADMADEIENTTVSVVFTFVGLVVGAWAALAAGATVGILVYGWVL